MNEHIMDNREDKEDKHGKQAITQSSGDLQAWDHGVSRKLAHSTPDPDAEPTPPNSIPDDIPPPAHAPVQEPTLPEPPIKANRNQGQ
ncbi:MAG: hypothetical protein H7335_11195 [Massilia sp.]|nr:hypothetical protein [Massilia sp.]